MDRLIEKIDDNFVKHSEIKSLEKEFEKRFDGLEKKFASIAESRNNEKWVIRLLLAISVIVNIIGLYEIFN